MPVKKEQWTPIVTNYLKNGEINHDMTGVVIPDDHVFYDVEHSLHKKQRERA
ncbi:hypothetical protein RIM63_08160 [Streptococcus equi subsp. zooepidemicus]|uniref:BOW99_gp33 family protein n=1 Tax=Streptococcus equi TaxID=1336 RepID=UPI00294AFD1A|nr:hypothetical protein [Streptococcus equi]WOK56836.1 hypothetical protein RIM63_08160 [Streptococcus equi subsp. zooepidemicus]HEL0676316.1 hypothetical protein [Streptococcus equi subsp. zooepidemicus]